MAAYTESLEPSQMIGRTVSVHIRTTTAVAIANVVSVSTTTEPNQSPFPFSCCWRLLLFYLQVVFSDRK